MVNSINEPKDMPFVFRDVFSSAKSYIKCTFNSTYNKKGLERIHLQTKDHIENMISKLLAKLRNNEKSFSYFWPNR